MCRLFALYRPCSWHCTPRSTAVWHAGCPVAVDTRSLASCGSSTKRGRSLKKKPGKLIAAALSKGRSPECPEFWTSAFLLLRVLRKPQRAVAQRSPLKKKDSSSCRHCFPDFSRAELEWLNHFRSHGRHSVD